MADAFYALDGDIATPSVLTRGPWDPNAQHGGPPAALLGRAIERCDAREGFFVGRVTVEILGPVPIAPLTVHARVARPGRNVELVEATLAAGGRDLARANAWRMRGAASPAGVGADLREVPGDPHTATPLPAVPFGEMIGYPTAMDWRFSRGDFMESGPATSWLRMRVPLVAGEEPSPLVRTLVAADVGNGISNVLDFSEYLFINTDLTVHLQRAPVGEWIGVDANTVIAPGGAGLAESRLFDTSGPIGRAAQTLFVTGRAR